MKKNINCLAIFAIVLSIMINYGCPSILGYNIVGTWSVTATYDLGGTEDWTITFTGDKKTGSVTLSDNSSSLSGTYEVDGKNIDFEVSASDRITSLTGTFTNNKEMSGSGTELYYSSASSVLSKMMKREAKAAAQSESFTFEWVGTKI